MDSYTQTAVEILEAAGIKNYLDLDASRYLADFGESNSYRLSIRAFVDVLMYGLLFAAQGHDDAHVDAELENVSKLFSDKPSAPATADVIRKEYGRFLGASRAATLGAAETGELVEGLERIIAMCRTPDPSWGIAHIISEIYVEKYGLETIFVSEVACHSAVFALLMGRIVPEVLVPNKNTPKIAFLYSLVKRRVGASPTSWMNATIETVQKYLVSLGDIVDADKFSLLESIPLEDRLAMFLGISEKLASKYRMFPAEYKRVVELVYGAGFFEKVDAFDDLLPEEKGQYVAQMKKELGYD